MLQIKNLRVEYESDNKIITAVDGINLTIEEKQIVGLVGGSGCGKSTVALSILNLIEKPGRIAGGQILWDGKDLLKMGSDEIRKVRGSQISMIFQDPFSSLNPVFTVGDQISETIRYHEGLGKRSALLRAQELLSDVMIDNPALRLKQYPHELSGGMLQRVMIAMAIACGPKLLIADEPTTSLDVTVQSEILQLMIDLKNNLGLGILFITHNLASVAEICDLVAVMKDGRIVEQSDVFKIFEKPASDYTKELLKAVPKLKC